MQTYHDISLKPYNTFGLEARARQMLVLERAEDVEAIGSNQPCFVLGAGSNVLFSGNFDGTIIRLAPRSEAVELPGGLVSAWGGMAMDDLVEWTLAHGLYGLENLSAIPSTVGASAVQNVGAYGIEAKDVIDRVEAYDLQRRQHCLFTNSECLFGYRDSLFKHSAHRYVVLRVVFRLRREYTPVLTYSALSNLPHATAHQMRASITQLRWHKLPKPEEHGSAGSFFKNPVVAESTYAELRANYPEMPEAHSTPAGYKLSAGWLIDQCGWKGRSMGRVGVWPHQALVLYNRGNCTYSEVQALAEAIRLDVYNKFGVSLDAEAETI